MEARVQIQAQIIALRICQRLCLVALPVLQPIVVECAVGNVPVYLHVDKDREVSLLALLVIESQIISPGFLHLELICNLLTRVLERRVVDSVKRLDLHIVGIQVHLQFTGGAD